MLNLENIPNKCKQCDYYLMEMITNKQYCAISIDNRNKAVTNLCYTVTFSGNILDSTHYYNSTRIE